MSIVVWDVDNCISNDMHRMHLLPNDVRLYARESEPQSLTQKPRSQLRDADFHDYHVACVHDEFCNQEVFFDSVPQQWGMEPVLIFLTAMPEHYRHLRVWWLKHHTGIKNFHLLMRPDNNHERSDRVKVAALRGWLDFNRYHGQEIECIYDDRVDVLAAMDINFYCPTKRIVINE